MNPSHPHKRSNFRFALQVIGLLIRGFALIFITLIAVAVGLFLSFPKLVDSERARQIIMTQLGDILHRPVQIKGVVLTAQGVKLEGVEVFSKLDPGRPLIESQVALVTIKLKPLLDKRLEISNLKLVGPHIRLWRDEEGVWNIADLFPSTSTVRATSVGRFALPVTLAAETSVVESGTLEIDDRMRHTNYTFERVNLTFHKFDFDRPFPLTASFDNVSHIADREFHVSATLEGSMSLASQDWPAAYIRAERVEAKVDGRMVRGTASLSDFSKPVLEADLLVPALGAPEWETYLKHPLELAVPPSRWHAKITRMGPASYKIDRLQATAGPFSAISAGTLDFTGDKPRVEAFTTFAEFPLYDLSAYKPSLDQYRFKGTASGEVGVSGWTDRLVVHRAKLHLRDFSGAFAHFTINKGDIDMAASDDFARFSASASRGAVTAFSNIFTEVSGQLSLTRQDLDLDNVTFRWLDSKARVKARITNVTKPKEVEFSGNVDHIRWERAAELVSSIIAAVSTRTATVSKPDDDDDPSRPAWVQTFKYVIPRKWPDSIGHFHVGHVEHKNFHFDGTDFLWDLRGVTPSLDKVNGDIYVGFGPGGVNDVQAVQDSNKFLKIVFLPFIYMHKMNQASILSTMTLFPTQFDFNRIEGDYAISQGVVTTHFTRVDSPQLLAYAEGTADFGREKVNMSILTRLTTVLEKLPEWWVDEKGRAAIGFKVTGDMAHPDLEPRLRKIGEDEIEKDIDAGSTRAKARFEVIEKLRTLEEVK